MTSKLDLPPLTPCSSRPRHEVLRIAHRGLELSGEPAEQVCRELADQGAHMLEIDVRVTFDDELIVWHDPYLLGADGTRTWVYDLPAADLARLAPSVAGLRRVLEAAAEARLGVYADIKALTPRGADNLVQAIERTGLSEHCILASSRSDIVAGLARRAPHLPRAVLFGPLDEDPVQLATSVAAGFAHPCWERMAAPHEYLSADWLARIRARGLGVITWHEERPEVLRALLDLGVDGICTDDVSTLSALAAG